MEVFMIKSRFQQYAPTNLSSKLPGSTAVPRDLGEGLNATATIVVTSPGPRKSASDMNSTSTDGLLYTDNSTSFFLWNDSASVGLFNLSGNLSDDYPNFDYELHTKNGSVFDGEPWTFCSEWTAAQHTMFQAANLFFAAAFLVPMSFKQSVLLVRYVFFFLNNSCSS